MPSNAPSSIIEIRLLRKSLQILHIMIRTTTTITKIITISHNVTMLKSISLRKSIYKAPYVAKVNRGAGCFRRWSEMLQMSCSWLLISDTLVLSLRRNYPTFIKFWSVNTATIKAHGWNDATIKKQELIATRQCGSSETDGSKRLIGFHHIEFAHH